MTGSYELKSEQSGSKRLTREQNGSKRLEMECRYGQKKGDQ